MRYWFDTEFNEKDGVLNLISIAVISEDGRQYYAESSEFLDTLLEPWLTKNVISKLTGPKKSKATIRQELIDFFKPTPTEIWAYFGEYDWIVLRQVFGHMLEWPEGWPLSHMNIEQLRLSVKHSAFSSQSSNAHHALSDAVWCKNAWEELQETNV